MEAMDGWTQLTFHAPHTQALVCVCMRVHACVGQEVKQINLSLSLTLTLSLSLSVC